VASRYRFYVLVLMVGIALLNYMDRWVGSAVAPLIQAEFDLSDFSIGLLGSAFTLIYALAALALRSVQPDEVAMDKAWAARARATWRPAH
jgi:sugar phosphate permease